MSKMIALIPVALLAFACGGGEATPAAEAPAAEATPPAGDAAPAPAADAPAGDAKPAEGGDAKPAEPAK
ncbi:MAG TPA: hypothetical protein VNN72_01745 [Polyangiaceae bacterium]|jgi:hypothetical protein|nr:hypothetical protein [Polyangiaceae bacterium]